MPQPYSFLEYFGFLRRMHFKIPDLDAEKTDCPICLEPFSSDPYQPRQPINRPVSLGCGHTFGYSCLATYIFSPSFQNKCPLCLSQMIPDTDMAVVKSLEQTVESTKELFDKLFEYDIPVNFSFLLPGIPISQVATLDTRRRLEETRELRERLTICFEAYQEAGNGIELPTMLRFVIQDVQDAHAAAANSRPTLADVEIESSGDAASTR